MRIEKLDFEIAKTKLAEYKNSLVYYISSTELARDEFREVNWSQCNEARFFSEDSELRFFRDGDNWIASRLSDDPEDKSCDIKYELDNRFVSVGKVIIVREYLKPDEDGQMFIVAKRLVSFE